VSERILKGAIEVVNAYYGVVSYNVAKMLIDGEKEPANGKEKAIILVFQTLKHMFVINYYIETIEENRYEEAEEVIELLQEDLIKYIAHLIDDVREIRDTRMHDKIDEIVEYITRGIDAYRKIKGNMQTLVRKIKRKIGEIKDEETKNKILNALATSRLNEL